MTRHFSDEAKFLLDFHYSDTWADPGKQFHPEGLGGPAARGAGEAVRDYTRDTIAAFREAGVMPDMVQIGNEIIHGMLWPDGRLPENWDNFAELLKAGIAGVDAGAGDGPRPRIMIHIDQGGDSAAHEAFFDKLLTTAWSSTSSASSYYPWWHGSPPRPAREPGLHGRDYHKDIMVVETAYNWRPARIPRAARARSPRPPRARRSSWRR